MALMLVENFESRTLGDLDGQGSWVTQYSGGPSQNNPQFHVVGGSIVEGVKSVTLYDTGGTKSYSEITHPLPNPARVATFNVVVPDSAPLASQINLDFFSGPLDIVTYDTWSCGMVFLDSGPYLSVTVYDQGNPSGVNYAIPGAPGDKLSCRILFTPAGTYALYVNDTPTFTPIFRTLFTGNESVVRFGFGCAAAMPAVADYFDNFAFVDGVSPFPSFFQVP